jgi:hypothetical protein
MLSALYNIERLSIILLLSGTNYNYSQLNIKQTRYVTS